MLNFFKFGDSSATLWEAHSDSDDDIEEQKNLITGSRNINNNFICEPVFDYAIQYFNNHNYIIEYIICDNNEKHIINVFDKRNNNILNFDDFYISLYDYKCINNNNICNQYIYINLAGTNVVCTLCKNKHSVNQIMKK